jgi:2-hydroxy-3-keto-5-methylthiopentenyl-1-phosphate phosphatase
VYTDFDGTVARGDVTDAVLRRFAPQEWETIERAWRSGEIDGAACMRAQIGLIEAPTTALDEFLDQIDLDPAFPRFVAWCTEECIPLTIVSDGVDYFAKRILERHGLAHLPVFANQLVFGSGRYALRQPWCASNCRAGAGVCKCVIASEWGSSRGTDPLVYVGDGRSDLCVSACADFLFAKDDLASHCRSQDLPYFPFESFDEVRETLLTLA